MQLANIVRERWKGVLFCLIIAIPATLLGKQIEVVGGPVFAILFGMVLALVFPKNRREQLAAGVTYTSKKVLQYAVILLGFGMNLSQILSKGAQSLPIIVATISTRWFNTERSQRHEPGTLPVQWQSEVREHAVQRL